MFRVFVRKRKRRLSSPRTIALSIGAHLLLVGGIVAASTAAPPLEETVIEIPIGPAPVEPPPPPAPAPVETPASDDAPRPVPGETVQLPAPETVPTQIPPVDVDATPLTAAQTTGLGAVGDVYGPPPATPTPPTGTTVGESTDGDYVYDSGMVESLPGLANGREMAQHLRRNYPQMLADAAVSGRVLLEFVVDPDGRVRPGSVRVVESTNEQFSEASVRVAERFRFRPARVGDQ
ncbi:MAG TPA: TonB family protein, partial [Longimicrobium sp.]